MTPSSRTGAEAVKEEAGGQGAGIRRGGSVRGPGPGPEPGAPGPPSLPLPLITVAAGAVVAAAGADPAP